MKPAALLWTGGKDSFLAYLEVRNRLRVDQLVTFVPDPPRPFLAHPRECMAAQARALGIPHRCLPIREPVREAYEEAIKRLAAEGVEVLVTGDMDRVAGHDNWIVERARGRVEVERPLWHADRREVLETILDRGLRVVCTLARTSSFAETIAGRTFDRGLVDELIARQGHEGFDACGENGEYHTSVLDGPGFAHGLELVGPRVVETGAFHHLVFEAVRPRAT